MTRSTSFTAGNPSFDMTVSEMETQDYGASTPSAPNRKRRILALAAVFGFAAAVAGVAFGTYTAGVSEGKNQINTDLEQQIAAARGTLPDLQCLGECLQEATGHLMPEVMQLKIAERAKYAKERAEMGDRLPALKTSARQNCVGGFAGEYPCKNVDLLSFTPNSAMGGSGRDSNDIWGWTDPENGDEYALHCMESGTAVVRVTDPVNPVPVAFIKTASVNSSWRDVKVYKNHMYIVSEASNHGMQVFDLTRVRGRTSLATLEADTTYKGGSHSSSHNIVINEDTGFGYSVGTKTCSGGLHMINLQVPKEPTFAGCYSGDGYTHDAQCVIYTGPDSRYKGREICFNYNEDTLTIVDVTDKSNPVQIARQGYSGNKYSHQGWLTEDQRYLLLDDELDEKNGGGDGKTLTYLWDVSSLTAPENFETYKGPVVSIDHNLYIKGNYAYHANYASGLRITDVSDLRGQGLKEVAYFDVHPANDRATFQGSWSSYPYFPSGNVIISSIELGLFVVRPNLSTTPPTPGATKAPTTPSPTLPPVETPTDCECDGGTSTYEKCVYYSAFENNVCFLKYDGPSSSSPASICPTPVGGRFAYSTNFGRWYVVGCEIPQGQQPIV